MHEFSLIKHLNNVEEPKTSPLAEGIEYQQYELVVDRGIITVNIPLRESKNFEASLTETNAILTRQSLKIILREFRGIRER